MICSIASTFSCWFISTMLLISDSVGKVFSSQSTGYQVSTSSSDRARIAASTSPTSSAVTRLICGSCDASGDEDRALLREVSEDCELVISLSAPQPVSRSVERITILTILFLNWIHSLWNCTQRAPLNLQYNGPEFIAIISSRLHLEPGIGSTSPGSIVVLC